MGVSCDHVRKGRGKRVERLMCLYVGACVCLSTATFGKLLSHLGLCVIFQQHEELTAIGSSLWNALPSSPCLILLSGSLSASIFPLKTYFYFWGLCTGSAAEQWSNYQKISKGAHTIVNANEAMLLITGG